MLGGKTLDGLQINNPTAERRRKASETVRPRRPRLNAELLLSQKGFPTLRNHAIPANLDQVISLYRDWASNLFNGYHFEDFIDKVERECHSKYLQVNGVFYLCRDI